MKSRRPQKPPYTGMASGFAPAAFHIFRIRHPDMFKPIPESRPWGAVTNVGRPAPRRVDVLPVEKRGAAW